ncbi:MAG: alpha/beta hydrolase, partial [Actinomycetota bacterium]|nr:alpha/beta hydrolase [Actinomycetota bacterium]
GPLAVCVHGLEGSAYNWRPIAKRLAKTHTVVAPDLSGFGHTDPGDRPVTVDYNAELVAGVIRHYGAPALVFGNSMGGLVSMITAATEPDLVQGLVLIDPAGPVASWRHIKPRTTVMLGAPLLPGIGSTVVDAYRASRTAEEGVAESYKFVTADPTTVSDEAYKDALEIAHLRREQPWATRSFIQATRSIARYVLRRGTYRRLIHRVAQPTLLVHGTVDAVVGVGTAKWIANERPDWAVAYMKDLGHIPMVESPETFMDIYDLWAGAAAISPHSP